jgi:hypothetical protein
VTGTDAYEPDNTPAEATIFEDGDTQMRSFYSATDVEWVQFYAPTGLIFNVDTTQLGTNSDIQLNLYYEQPDGSLEFIYDVNDYGPGSNITESLTVDLKTGQSGLLPGVYYVEVSSANTNLYGPGSEYELQIYEPVGGNNGGVVLLGNAVGSLFSVGSFNVTLGPPAALAAGAGWQVTELTNQTYYSDNSATYVLPAAGYMLTFENAAGYATPTNCPLVVTANETTTLNVNYTSVVSYANKPVCSNGVVRLSFTAPAGLSYVIERSTNLVVWVPLTTNTVPANGVLQITDLVSTNPPHAFYRALYGSATNYSPQAGVLAYNSGAIKLSFTAPAGLKYAIDRSTNLTTWVPLLTNTVAANGTLQFSDVVSTNLPRAFYRARYTP